MRYEGVNIQSGGRKEAGDESKGKGEQGRKQGNRNNWKMSIVKGEEQVRKWGKEVKCMAVWALGFGHDFVSFLSSYPLHRLRTHRWPLGPFTLLKGTEKEICWAQR